MLEVADALARARQAREEWYAAMDAMLAAGQRFADLTRELQEVEAADASFDWADEDFPPGPPC